ncbi:MAG TPA: radical SAM protein, partial [bacterium]
MLQSHYLYFLKHNIISRLFQIRQPLLASFKITYRCTLKCRSCPFWKMEPLSISFHRAVEIINEFQRKGVRLLIFEGGEPFLWRDGDYRLENLVRFA